MRAVDSLTESPTADSPSRNALDLVPHSYLADVLSQLGRFDEAIGHGEAACGSLKRPIIPSHCTAG